MTGALSWARDGRDWPHRAASRFVQAGGLSWHVQEMGQGPTLLLLHGTGASTHSWRDLLPLLARDFHVVAPDLPGHGFTEAPERDRLSLPAMARGLTALLGKLGVEPEGIVGHSAGAAIAMQMVLTGAVAPSCLISLNGALLPFKGVASQLFPSVARLLVLNPLVPRLFAWRAGSTEAVTQLLEGMGSRLDARGQDLYQRLFSNRVHVASTLGMMANWDLEALGRSFGRLDLPVLLVVGAGDRAVPPGDARAVAQRLPDARIETLPGAGHLIHEEKPGDIAALIGAEMLRHREVIAC
ncbi:alpha/beta fold hydrolase BchO [Bosea sp. (in: a-proteobacteria)]|uniref:alpha/beta fold hydrolase BchO n=1 Tax=Bosea sp. (in: a-proteobacteria) TaxID=1871050 RepID=UPI002B4626F0|nr:alpha/beta fold hydrolase BchO [Bosea sp. (in: a-proteobacteria)]WRH60521.1 MAG: alpha/beta fold hydrolase [Bosea sp. (in: a-proteobacteria)]